MADALTEIALGLQGCVRVGQLMDAGELPPEAISVVKRNSCGKALHIARVTIASLMLCDSFHAHRLPGTCLEGMALWTSIM